MRVSQCASESVRECERVCARERVRERVCERVCARASTHNYLLRTPHNHYLLIASGTTTTYQARPSIPRSIFASAAFTFSNSWQRLALLHLFFTKSGPIQSLAV